MVHPRDDRILLILDLDETLVHASEVPLGRAADFRVGPYHVYRRPHLDEFLDICARDFQVAVWSSASDNYAEAVVREIFPPERLPLFVWGRSRATLRRVLRPEDALLDPWDHRHYRKPLAKLRRLGWRLERVLIVDDTRAKCAGNYGNAVYPSPYEGATDDDELKWLGRYLPSLRDVADVRRIEKRRWRERIADAAGT